MAYRMIETESGMRERGGFGAKKIINGIYAMLDELCETIEDEGMHERGGMYERGGMQDIDGGMYERMGMRRGRDSRGRYM